MKLNARKIFLFCLLIIVTQSQEIEIKAYYDVVTNTIRYNGEIFKNFHQTNFVEEIGDKVVFNSPEFWMDVLMILCNV